MKNTHTHPKKHNHPCSGPLLLVQPMKKNCISLKLSPLNLFKCPKSTFICIVSLHLKKIPSWLLPILLGYRRPLIPAAEVPVCSEDCLILQGTTEQHVAVAFLAQAWYLAVGGFSLVWVLLQDSEWHDVSAHSTPYITYKPKRSGWRFVQQINKIFKARIKAFPPASQEKAKQIVNKQCSQQNDPKWTMSFLGLCHSK